MTPIHDHLRSALYASAILSSRKDLDYLQRGEIVSHVQSHGPHSVPELRRELQAGVKENNSSGGTDGCRASDRLSETVDQWLEQGVYVIKSDGHYRAGDRLNEKAPVFFARGDVSLLRRPIAAILNSRKPRRISPYDRWVGTTLAGVRIAAQQGYVIATSYGTGPYDLVGAAAGRNVCSVIVVCPEVLPFMAGKEEGREFSETYGELFASDESLFLSPFSPGSVPRQAIRMRLRDEITSALAQFLLIAEIREQGTMIDILGSTLESKERITVFMPNVEDEATSGNARVRDMTAALTVEVLSDESIRNSRPKVGSKPPITLSRTKPDALLLNPVIKDTHLIHYTRSCPGPWPGQSMRDYYHALIDNRSGAEHSAFDTLKRVLSEKLLRGSETFVRGKTPVVSFTERIPHEIGELVRWRRGLIRWTFEPYGIAIDKRILVSLGAEPVDYGDEEKFKELPPNRAYLFQLRESGDNDWSTEKEWRIRGDLRLDDIPQEHITVVVPSLEEARLISLEFGYSVTLSGASFEKNF